VPTLLSSMKIPLVTATKPLLLNLVALQCAISSVSPAQQLPISPLKPAHAQHTQ
jgi:hypothetical protein